MNTIPSQPNQPSGDSIKLAEGSSDSQQPSPEAPLEGLCERPLNTMSDSELRDWVVRIQQNRNSSITFKSRVEAQSEEQKVAKTNKVLQDLNEFF